MSADPSARRSPSPRQRRSQDERVDALERSLEQLRQDIVRLKAAIVCLSGELDELQDRYRELVNFNRCLRADAGNTSGSRSAPSSTPPTSDDVAPISGLRSGPDHTALPTQYGATGIGRGNRSNRSGPPAAADETGSRRGTSSHGPY